MVARNLSRNAPFLFMLAPGIILLLVFNYLPMAGILVALIFLNLWKNVGYRTVIFISAIAIIDIELYESARVDGANKWQQILKITLPSLIPLVIILVILDLGRIFNADFGLFYQATSQMGGGFLQPTVNVIDTYVYNALINNGDVGMASAAGLYQAVVGFVTILGANFAIRRINKDYALF